MLKNFYVYSSIIIYISYDIYIYIYIYKLYIYIYLSIKADITWPDLKIWIQSICMRYMNTILLSSIFNSPVVKPRFIRGIATWTVDSHVETPWKKRIVFFPFNPYSCRLIIIIQICIYIYISHLYNITIISIIIAMLIRIHLPEHSCYHTATSGWLPKTNSSPFLRHTGLIPD